MKLHPQRHHHTAHANCLEKAPRQLSRALKHAERGVQALGDEKMRRSCLAPARDVTARGGERATWILNERSSDEVRSDCAGLHALDQLTVAVVHEEDELKRCGRAA